MVQRVAIVGDGPAASALGFQLARRGVRAVVLGRGQRPELLVGESLVPGIVPMLRELGVEDEVASYSVIKPGATFRMGADGPVFHFRFAQTKGELPAYAYNSPRDLLDASVRRAAARAGVAVVERAVRVERVPGDPDRVALDEGSAAAARDALGGEPDLLVDATGRARAFARALDLPTETGPRRDTALFAHLDGAMVHDPGHVHTDRLTHGWSWRIPLPGRTSVGVVVPSDVLARYGDGIEARYDRFLAEEPWMRHVTGRARRLTRVMRYDNYQLTTLRGVGANWALVGDAFGFVDPVFSPGLYLALAGGRELATALVDGSEAALGRYESWVLDQLEAWRRGVSYYYDGRLFTLLQVGEEQRRNVVGRAIAPLMERHVPRCFTGEAQAGSFSRRLLDFMVGFATYGRDPAELAVA